MAKTPQFNSDKAKEKWKSLENQAGVSLNKIVKGTATSQDFNKVSSVLKKLSEVASTVFDEAVDAAKESAKALADQEKIDFDSALNRVLEPKLEELQLTIADAFEMDLAKLRQNLKEDLGTRFDDIEKSMPKDPVSTDDLLAAVELVDENTEETFDNKTDSMLDNLFIMVRGFINDFQIKQAESPTLADEASSAIFSNETEPENREELETAPISIQTGAVENATAEPQVKTQDWADLKEFLDKKFTSLKPNQDKNLKEQLEDRFDMGDDEDEEADIEEFLSQSFTAIQNKLNNILDSVANKKPEPEEENEESPSTKPSQEKRNRRDKDKADTWWKSFKKWIGDGFLDKSKKAGSSILDALKGLGFAGLLALLLNPELWKSIVSNIENYLTFDRLKGWVSDAWSWVADKGKIVVDDALQFFGKTWDWITKEAQPVVDLINKFIDKSENYIEKTVVTPVKAAYQDVFHSNDTAKLTKSEASKAANLTPEEYYSVFLKGKGPETQALILKNATQTQQEGILKEHPELKAMAGNITPATAVAAAPTAKGGVSTGSARASINISNPVTTNSSSSNTFPSPDQATVQNSIAVPSAGSQANKSKSNNQTTVIGTPQVSMNSFGFQQGVDDNLLLMNSSLLG